MSLASCILLRYMLEKDGGWTYTFSKVTSEILLL